MGTKTNPGKYDCIAKAEPDEPMFTLLARDPVAAHLVSIWAKLRVQDYEAARRVFDDLMVKHFRRSQTSDNRSEVDMDKAQEAIGCVMDMFEWIKKNRPERAL
jgi:hypothetical protein